MHSGEPVSGHSERVAFCKPGAEAAEEIKPAGTVILDFQPPGL